MKFLAILRDSILETIDFKIFYVMIGLSLFLCLILGLFTFPRHQPIQALGNNLGAFEVSQVETLEHGWFSPYARYLCLLQESAAKPMGSAMQRAIQDYDREQLQAELAMRGQFEEMRSIELKLPAPPPEPKSAEDWRRLVDRYLASIPGITDANILSYQEGGGQPQTIRVELGVNWGEIRHAHDFSFLFGVYRTSMGEFPLGQLVSILQSLLVGWIAGWVGIIVSVIVTGGFIPNMLRKGTIDLLLVKPISRPALLLYKYLGGLLFVFFNVAVFVGGTWLVFGLTTNFWSPWYLTSALVLVFFFGILYSLSTLVGVLTRSTLASILVTIGCWVGLWLIGIVYSLCHPAELQTSMMPFLKDIPTPIVKVVDAIHFILPKTNDLKVLNEALLLQASGSERALRQQEQVLKNFSWTETISTSAVFIALMLGLASWRFARRDY
jgi:ABC-type transport system involved in multi-copper enzyme maturation permease subunit